MKINLKAIAAAVVLVAIIVWAFSTLRTITATGGPLTVSVGGGNLSLTNPADEPVAAQLVGTGARTFTVRSETEALAGSSVKLGTGRDTTQVFDFMVPPGASQLIIDRGVNVQFISATDSPLTAAVEPFSPDNTRTTLMIAVAASLIVIFYLSHTTGHQILRFLGNRNAAVETSTTPHSPVNIFTLGKDKEVKLSTAAPTNFKEWLMNQRNRQDAVGDFARTAAADSSFANDAIDVRQKLRRFNASDETMEACAQAIREYNLTSSQATV